MEGKALSLLWTLATCDTTEYDKQKQKQKTKTTFEIILDLVFPFFQWLWIINIAVLYNLIFVPGRAIFWELDRLFPRGKTSS